MKKLCAALLSAVMLLTGTNIQIPASAQTQIKEQYDAFDGTDFASDGDINQDGITDLTDAELLQGSLLGRSDTDLFAWRTGDMNGDGILNAVDLSILKQILYQKQNDDSWLTEEKSISRIIAELTYQKGETAQGNPYKGFAAWANDSRQRNMDFSLVYVDIYWDQLEPEEGCFDFQSLEEKNHFALWKEEGKQAIFRVVLDCPTSKQHKNIPEWLYEKTGDGKYYSVSYGKGYCPDYGNQTLLEAHRMMLKALAKRYRNDGFLAYIELGSLGHWGEWHIHDDIGIDLSPEIYEKYLQQYLDIFPDTKMLTRRPFEMATENGMGLYNDSFARESETERFIKWIDEGGDYKQYPDALSPAPNAWYSAPIGGEISSSIDRFAVLDNEADSLTETLKALHVTFIGPTNWLGKSLSDEQLAYAQQISDAMGYDFYVRSLRIYDGGENRKCVAELCNDGCAPLYFPYDIIIKYRSDECSTTETLDADITSLYPGESLSLEFTIPNDAASLWIALKNSNTDGIYLSNDTERNGYWQKLY